MITKSAQLERCRLDRRFSGMKQLVIPFQQTFANAQERLPIGSL